MPNEQTFPLAYPTLLDRIKSTTIDSLLIIAAAFLISEILAMTGGVPTSVKITLMALILLYEPLCTAFGATIGNDKMKIRVRSVNNPEKRINLFLAIIRFIFKILLGWLSFITFFTSSRNRAIHDIVSGSVVIQVVD